MFGAENVVFQNLSHDWRVYVRTRTDFHDIPRRDLIMSETAMPHWDTFIGVFTLANRT